MILEINEVLEQRAKTHGDFIENSELAQKLKKLVRDSLKGKEVPYPIQEGLDMILHKTARASCGDYLEPDHYRDIAGYATLIARYLEKLQKG